jgi:type II secretory pathway component GspD/PulD (secretin)
VVWTWPAKSGSKQQHAPGLDKLPLIGPLFRNDDKDKTPREIVVFVTAHLIP